MGTDLGYRGDTAASTVFTTGTIGGETANVMQFPATANSQGYVLTHGIAANGIGISGDYDGVIAADTWHRVALVMDLTLAAEQMRKYIDGQLVGTQTLSSGVDGRWALNATAFLFTDEDGETASGFVSSIQIHDTALADSYILSLGGATANGISAIPEPATGLLLGAGLLLWAVRRRFNR